MLIDVNRKKHIYYIYIDDFPNWMPSMLVRGCPSYGLTEDFIVVGVDHPDCQWCITMFNIV